MLFTLIVESITWVRKRVE